jgi:TolB protein
MKNILLLFLLIGALQVNGQSKTYDYAYLNKKGICVYSLADKVEYPVVATMGDAPSLSPDGRKVAYTATNKKGDRFIAVMDLNTKKKTILNTSSNNCYGPVWSPNGKFIAYNVFNTQKSKWFIAVIDSGNTGAKVVTNSLEESYMPTWTYDSKNVVVQDMQNVYVVNLSGNITGTYKISDMIKLKNSGPSSGDRFMFTGDNKKIAFSSEVDEPGGNDGPPNAVFIYDTAGKTTLRLSLKGYFADGVVVKGSQVLFTASKIKSLVQNVYSIDLDGRNLKILFPNCSSVSAK